MSNESYDLDRFIDAQSSVYDIALAEIRAGSKRTHWMWFIFPQMAGLGTSSMARRYAITGPGEARAYLEHPVLGPRLRECVRAMLGNAGRTAHEILGSPDDLKLRSCATLFARASNEPIFQELLDQFYDGVADPRTEALLASEQR